MVVFRQNSIIWVKVVVVWQKCFISEKKWLYSSNVVVIGQNGLYSGKSDCGRAKVDLFVQSGCIREFFNTGKVVVFRQKWFYSGKVDALR